MKNGYSGTELWNNTYKPYIRTIIFGNDLSNKPESCTGDSDLCWDVSYDASQKGKVYAYLVDSGLKDSTDSTKTLYNLYIVSEAPIFAPTSCFSLLANLKKLLTIDFNNNFNTSKVTTMGSMFMYYSSLINLDLSNFNTLNVTDMTWLFYSCNKIQTEFKIMNANVSYSGILGGYMSSGVSHWALSDENAYIIINYV